jgi:hypothetical protein
MRFAYFAPLASCWAVAVLREPLHKLGPKRNVLDLSWTRPAVPARELSFEIVLQIGTVVDRVSTEDRKYWVACLARLLGQISVTDQRDQFRRERNYFPQKLLASARTGRQPSPLRPPQLPPLYSRKKAIEGPVECLPYRTVVHPVVPLNWPLPPQQSNGKAKSNRRCALSSSACV